MIAGKEYRIKIRAKNFYTGYYNRGHLSPWSAETTFFSSNLPQTVAELTFTNRTKTDVTVHWQLHSNEAARGFSTIAPYYLLWVDNC